MSVALIGRILKNRMNNHDQPIVEMPLRKTGSSTLERLRIGSVLDLSGAAASFIEAEQHGTLMQNPNREMVHILGYGRVHDAPFRIHRFYFDVTGDKTPDAFLQVITDSGDNIVPAEVKIFEKLAEVNPASSEEWDLWLTGSDETPPLLTGPTIKWEETTEYARIWSPGVERARPKHYMESVRSHDNNAVVSHSVMLFGRDLIPAKRTEWLQLSICQSSSERWVEAYVGINVDPGELLSI